MPIRVLIVDDSAVIRRQLSDVLAADPEIAIAGAVGDGSLALKAIQNLKPDLITLDVEMPQMDGIQTLVEIRKLDSRLPVIMFSTLTGPGAEKTVEALARGASDYALKPSRAGSQDAARATVRDELIPKIKALCGARRRAGSTAAAAPQPVFTPPAYSAPKRIDLVAIASSTGGPNALGEVIPQFAADFPVPIVIVQHMPASFTKLLAARLDSSSKLRVREGEEGRALEKGNVWIAPGNYHMTVQRSGTQLTLGLNQEAQENSCRPAADVLFRSVARSVKENVLGVVLTGMGSDGTKGAATIRQAGGAVIVQDEASSVVWGMPGSVVAARLADKVCALNAIVPEIERRVAFRRLMTHAVHA
ncbi:MAG TPA: chemotaxis response regulator protein-glutamate methylesterase [Terriglobales bacterium]|nr:chemotaxis response regulator protein-glutamate methylesterase [Terriglobales bacterium]